MVVLKPGVFQVRPKKPGIKKMELQKRAKTPGKICAHKQFSHVN